jgi:EAL domain-containing protein (putative c-di-GMP-specific phosphodiesterase class I)|tara:strand:- start:8323 stop:9510 length:1188 start_codon:yes stop_codon:yes gene_type:complete
VITDSLNFGRDWGQLQETNDSLIVLDGKDLIVSCNELAQKTLFNANNYTEVTFLFDSFWLEAEKRVFYLSEFRSIVGKTITLLLRSIDREYYRVDVCVEAFSFLDQSLLSLTIQKSRAQISADGFEDARFSKTSLMAKALSEDLSNSMLELHYQPQINALDCRLYGVEVLSRWTSKAFGCVPPDDFIAIAEGFGLIATLDLWVLRQACQQLADWRKRNIEVPLIAVNFSPATFDFPDLKNTIQTTLKENNLLPSDLVLEVTENKEVVSAYQSADVIHDLYLMGIHISLDDFGVGYSNLKRLLKFPVSQLKLDRSFVMGLPQTISKDLSETVLGISQKIGAVSIAEGVETESQFFLLKEMGYEVIQGYFFARPLSRVHFEEWLSSIHNSLISPLKV